MKLEEIRALDQASLIKKVSEARKEVFNLRLKKGTSGLEKPNQLRAAKKNIARLLTVLKQKEGSHE